MVRRMDASGFWEPEEHAEKDPVRSAPEAKFDVDPDAPKTYTLD